MRTAFLYRVFATPLCEVGIVSCADRLTRVIISETRPTEVEAQIHEAFPGAEPAERGILVRAARELCSYAAGELTRFSLPLDLDFPTAFRRRVMQACLRIPFGECRTYGHLAAEVGAPRAARAVGQVMRSNPLPIVVPCHRVVGADGRLAGFSATGGLALKERLLAHEGVALNRGRVTVEAPPPPPGPRR